MPRSSAKPHPSRHFQEFPRTKIVVGRYPGAYGVAVNAGFRVQTSTHLRGTMQMKSLPTIIVGSAATVLMLNGIAFAQQQPQQPQQSQQSQYQQGQAQQHQLGQSQQYQQGQGQQPGQGQKTAQGQKPDQGKGKQPGPAQEKNEQRGTGQRVADGKVSNGASKQNDVQGDGTFLHLPPLIRRQPWVEHFHPLGIDDKPHTRGTFIDHPLDEGSFHIVIISESGEQS